MSIVDNYSRTQNTDIRTERQRDRETDRQTDRNRNRDREPTGTSEDWRLVTSTFRRTSNVF